MTIGRLKKIGSGIAVLLMIALCFTINAFGQDTQAPPPPPNGGHHGPPPEAYTACEGKSAGDTAEFITPHGDTVTGVCEEEDGRLVLRPDSPPEPPGEDGGNKNKEDVDS